MVKLTKDHNQEYSLVYHISPKEKKRYYPAQNYEHYTKAMIIVVIVAAI